MYSILLTLVAWHDLFCGDHKAKFRVSMSKGAANTIDGPEKLDRNVFQVLSQLNTRHVRVLSL